MGSGASMAASASAASYPTVEAALADGKSQVEIDAFLAVSPTQQENIVYAHAAVASTAAEQKKKEQAIEAAAEATALPNNRQPPDPVLVMIEGRGDFMTRLNNEKEKKQV